MTNQCTDSLLIIINFQIFSLYHMHSWTPLSPNRFSNLQQPVFRRFLVWLARKWRKILKLNPNKILLQFASFEIALLFCWVALIRFKLKRTLQKNRRIFSADSVDFQSSTSTDSTASTTAFWLSDVITGGSLRWVNLHESSTAGFNLQALISFFIMDKQLKFSLRRLLALPFRHELAESILTKRNLLIRGIRTVLDEEKDEWEKPWSNEDLFKVMDKDEKIKPRIRGFICSGWIWCWRRWLN